MQWKQQQKRLDEFKDPWDDKEKEPSLLHFSLCVLCCKKQKKHPGRQQKQCWAPRYFGCRNITLKNWHEYCWWARCISCATLAKVSACLRAMQGQKQAQCKICAHKSIWANKHMHWCKKKRAWAAQPAHDQWAGDSKTQPEWADGSMQRKHRLPKKKWRKYCSNCGL